MFFCKGTFPTLIQFTLSDRYQINIRHGEIDNTLSLDQSRFPAEMIVLFGKNQCMSDRIYGIPRAKIVNMRKWIILLRYNI